MTHCIILQTVPQCLLSVDTLLEHGLVDGDLAVIGGGLLQLFLSITHAQKKEPRCLHLDWHCATSPRHLRQCRCLALTCL